MTDSAITIIVGGILALANIIAGFLMWKIKAMAEAAVKQAEVAAEKAEETKEITKETHDVVNSRMDEFKKMAESYFRSLGALQEREDEQKRKALIAETIKASELVAAPVPAPIPTGLPAEIKIINTPSESIPTFEAKPKKP